MIRSSIGSPGAYERRRNAASTPSTRTTAARWRSITGGRVRPSTVVLPPVRSIVNRITYDPTGTAVSGVQVSSWMPGSSLVVILQAMLVARLAVWTASSVTLDGRLRREPDRRSISARDAR